MQRQRIIPLVHMARSAVDATRHHCCCCCCSPAQLPDPLALSGDHTPTSTLVLTSRSPSGGNHNALLTARLRLLSPPSIHVLHNTAHFTATHCHTTPPPPRPRCCNTNTAAVRHSTGTRLTAPPRVSHGGRQAAAAASGTNTVHESHTLALHHTGTVITSLSVHHARTKRCICYSSH